MHGIAGEDELVLVPFRGQHLGYVLASEHIAICRNHASRDWIGPREWVCQPISRGDFTTATPE